MSYTVFKQDLSEQVEYSSLNMLRLLFRKETELPSHDAIMEKLKKEIPFIAIALLPFVYLVFFFFVRICYKKNKRLRNLL